MKHSLKIIIPILFLIIFSIGFHQVASNIIDELEQDLTKAFDAQKLLVVNIASSRVGFHIDNDVAENVKLLGQFPAMQRKEIHNGTRDMEKVNLFAAPKVDGFLYFDTNGDLFTSYPKTIAYAYNGNKKDQPFFKSPLETGSLFFSDWVEVDGRLKILVSHPIFNTIVDVNFPAPDNEVSGILMAQVDFDKVVSNTLGRLKSSGLMYWVVDEKTKKILYHSVLPREQLSSVDSEETVLAEKLINSFDSVNLSPGTHTLEIDDKKYTVAASRSRIGSHRIIINLAYDDSNVSYMVQSKASSIYFLAISFIFLILLGGFVISYLFNKKSLLSENYDQLSSEKDDLSKELKLKEEKIKLEEGNKKLSEQIFQLQKMESLGELAAGTAHELNNALTEPLSILSRIEIDSDISATERMGLIGEAINGMVKVRTIVQGLLKFSRKEKNEKSIGSINKDIEFVCNIFKKDLIHSNIKLEINLASNLHKVNACHRLIQQVFLNILLNAKHVTKDFDTISITSNNQTIDSVKGVFIEFTDTGSGMPPEVCERIFEPFYSTKPIGEGTGLGLSISYGIISDHNGTLTVRSVENQGTTMNVWLPIK